MDIDKLKYEYIPDEEDVKEATVTKKVKAYLDKKEGVWYVKIHIGMGMARAGIPDILACVGGMFLAIEIKRKSGKLTELQKNTLNEIEKRSYGHTIVCYGFEDFKWKFEEKINEFYK